MSLIAAPEKKTRKPPELRRTRSECSLCFFLFFDRRECFFALTSTLSLPHSLPLPLLLLLPRLQPTTPAQHESLASLIDRRSDYYRRAAACEKCGSSIPASSSSPPRSPARGRSDGGPAPRHGAGGAVVHRRETLLTAPNVLTLFRLALVPVFFALWFVEHGTFAWAPPAAAAVFALAAATDWLDGYLARRLALTSAFGAFLDPVADKVMVCTALVLMAAAPPEPLGSAELSLPVVVVVCREIAMSALREWAAAADAGGGEGGGARSAVKVNSLGKWKTALQMVAMVALLALRHAASPGGWARRSGVPVAVIHAATRLSLGLLWAGALLAVASLYCYMSSVWRFFLYPGTGGPAPAPEEKKGEAPSSPQRPAARRRAA